MNIKHLIGKTLALLFASCVTLTSCSKNSSNNEEDLNVQFSVPSSVVIDQKNPVFTFKVLFDKAPRTDDVIIFTDASGADHKAPIVQVDGNYFTVDCKNVTAFGNYSVYVARGSQKKKMGDTTVTISDGVQPEEGSTVYGKVSCDGTGLPNVVISDGAEVVKTDAEGVYQLKSAKKYGYVFISTPSGYETASNGVLPINYFKLYKTAAVAERVDFTLQKAPDQSNYSMLVFGDMHLAGGRNKDRQWFSNFCSDVNEYLTTNKGETTYGITLGDMTWDYYWYSNSYQFSQYLADINAIKGLTIYQTIGNHDHDMNKAGDFETILPYVSLLAPDYYSFNIGKVHYIVLDNILCTNTGTGRDGRKYSVKVTQEQFDWLAKDLSYVSPSTPLVVTMHAPTFHFAASDKAALLNAFSAFKTVHFITGHTHIVANQTGSNYMDHNSGALCADWWWSVYNTDGALNIGTDGAPAGYQIFKVRGTDFSWQFKPTGFSADYQFRTYDRNQIDLSADKVMPSADAANKTYFNNFAGTWASSSSADEVYINVWNFAPGWSIEVTEDGKVLNNLTAVSYMDPLHILTTSVKYMKSTAGTTYYTTSVCPHLWKVTASSPTSTLEIKVTDSFGNVYKQTMTRPKAFDIDTYSKELVK